jgi:hypothetical protein
MLGDSSRSGVTDATAPGLLTYRIAGFGLTPDGGAGESFEVPAESWPFLLKSLKLEKITGLAVAAAERGWLRLSDGQMEDLLERHRSAMIWALALERTLLEMAVALEDQRIEFVVLKGPSLARTVYPDPSWRPFVDIDLLVRTTDWRGALSVLADMGFRRQLPEPRSGFDERFGKAATHAGTGGLAIDLHRTLVLGPFGLWMAPEELFQHAASFRVGGRDFPRLDDTALFLHACMHASLGFRFPQLLPLRDVAQTARFGEVDWEAFGDLVDRWRLTAVVQYAFRNVAESLHIPWPAEAQPIMERRAPRAERRALLAYTTKRNRGGMALATFRAIGGVRAKAAFAWSMLFPRRAFLSARAGPKGSATYRHRWVVPVRWLRADRPGEPR